MTASALGFPAVWLRHNCRCPECLDPVTGQRLIEVTAIPNGCGVTVEAQTTESVTVVFAPDGHRSVFSRAWLAERALPAGAPATAGRSPWLSGLAGVQQPVAARPAPGVAAGHEADRRTEDGKTLWRAADLADVPGADWDSYLADGAVRATCLDAVATLGFALLRGVPAKPGTVLRVARSGCPMSRRKRRTAPTARGRRCSPARSSC